MEQKTVTLNLTLDVANFILQVLSELPTKSGAFPVVVNIQDQIKPQLEEPKAE